MTTEELIKECHNLADLYRDASASRGIAEANVAIRPSLLTQQARFDAGMVETNAWEALVNRTSQLTNEGEFHLALHIRRTASEASTKAGVRALKAALAADKGAA